MRNIFITTLLFALSFSAQGQFFQFSQRHFTPQRVNPATVGSSDFFHAMMNFRNQTTAGDFSLLSTALDLAYPVSWGGSRRGGVGVFFLDDRAGTQSIYSIQEAGVSTSISIPTDARSSLNLGLGLGYQRRSFDFNGLSTGSQFVPDRGFDLSLGNGENFGDLSTSFVRWNAGIYWRKNTADNLLKSYIGFSAFDLNQADESVIGREALLPVSLIAETGLMINRTDKSILYAEGFAYGASDNYSLQAGVMLQREMQRSQQLKVRARYSTESFVILGATIEKGNFAIGATYDIGIGKSGVSNQSAFEVGIGWKLAVTPKGRKKKKKEGEGERTIRPQAELPVDTLTQEEPEPVLPDSTQTEIQPQPDPVTDLTIGRPSSRKRIVDEYEVRLPFRFNSAELSDQFAEFLDEVISRLEANPDHVVQITGHTDDVGSEEVNLRISIARAEAAANYLISKGIDSSRIEAIGKGETLPLSTNSTAAGRALNRRVEIKILKEE